MISGIDTPVTALTEVSDYRNTSMLNERPAEQLFRLCTSRYNRVSIHQMHSVTILKQQKYLQFVIKDSELMSVTKVCVPFDSPLPNLKRNKQKRENGPPARPFPKDEKRDFGLILRLYEPCPNIHTKP